MSEVMKDWLVRGDLREIDPAVAELIDYEVARQVHKLILIPSESAAAGFCPTDLMRSPRVVFSSSHQLAGTRRKAACIATSRR